MDDRFVQLTNEVDQAQKGKQGGRDGPEHEPRTVVRPLAEGDQRAQEVFGDLHLGGVVLDAGKELAEPERVLRTKAFAS